MVNRKYLFDEMVINPSRFRVNSKNLRLTNSSMLKGDFVGHPFRGNQWSDSSGANRSGAGGGIQPDDSLTKFKVISDSKATTIADKINQKSTVSIRDEKSTVENFLLPDKRFDKAKAESLFDELDKYWASGAGVPVSEVESLERTTGLDMLTAAINERIKNPVDLIILRNKSNLIAGAVSFDNEGKTLDNSSNKKFLEISYMGTLGLVEGAGSTLFGLVISRAASINSGIYLQPLDFAARKYFTLMGFEDYVANDGGTGDTVMILSPESVSKISERLEP